MRYLENRARLKEGALSLGPLHREKGSELPLQFLQRRKAGWKERKDQS